MGFWVDMRKINNIKLIVPVWGHKYINLFLDFSLKSMLSNINITFFQTKEVELIICTSIFDKHVFNSSVYLKDVEKILKIKYLFIDDLIGGPVSLSITKAYAKAINYFIGSPGVIYYCLMPDYIYAEGAISKSYNYLLKHNYNGLNAGNFQASEEVFLNKLMYLGTKSNIGWNLDTRELIDQAKNWLHPITQANIINLENYRLNLSQNRLFWLTPNGTLLGKFYLMHPLCVVPEVDHFVPTGPIDYSLMSELVPSGNYGYITSSKDYFVLELQKNEHELLHLKFTTKKLENFKAIGNRIKKWVIPEQIENSKQTVVYFDSLSEESDIKTSIINFNDVNDKIIEVIGKPKSNFRNHPFYIGATSAYALMNSNSDVNSFLNIMGYDYFKDYPKLAKQFGLFLFGYFIQNYSSIFKLMDYLTKTHIISKQDHCLLLGNFSIEDYFSLYSSSVSYQTAPTVENFYQIYLENKFNSGNMTISGVQILIIKDQLNWQNTIKNVIDIHRLRYIFPNLSKIIFIIDEASDAMENFEFSNFQFKLRPVIGFKNIDRNLNISSAFRRIFTSPNTFKIIAKLTISSAKLFLKFSNVRIRKRKHLKTLSVYVDTL